MQKFLSFWSIFLNFFISERIKNCTLRGGKDIKLEGSPFVDVNFAENNRQGSILKANASMWNLCD